MNRQRVISAVAIGAIAVVLGWALMSFLGRALRDTAPADTGIDTPAQPQQPGAPGPAVPRIKATLFFASEDGRGLVGIEQEIPLAEGIVAQARALVEAQLAAAPPDPLVSALPQDTKLRALFVSDNNEAFVDLDKAVRDNHPGGSMNELFTVYTIVNAVTTNLPTIQTVQILIDGREVDTLAGHVDLRKPLRKNELLIAKGLTP